MKDTDKRPNNVIPFPVKRARGYEIIVLRDDMDLEDKRESTNILRSLGDWFIAILVACLVVFGI